MLLYLFSCTHLYMNPIFTVFRLQITLVELRGFNEINQIVVVVGRSVGGKCFNPPPAYKHD